VRRDDQRGRSPRDRAGSSGPIYRTVGAGRRDPSRDSTHDATTPRAGAWRATGEAARQALATLRAHPLRSSLGGLAITVAVATIAIVVTALDAVGDFARSSAERAFAATAS